MSTITERGNGDPGIHTEQRAVDEAHSASGPESTAAIDLIRLLLRTFRTRGLHEWQNRAMVRQLEQLMISIEEILGGRESVAVELHEHSLFVESEKVRVSSKGFDLLRTFADVLDERGIGGLKILAEVEPKQLRRLIDLLLEFDDRNCFATVTKTLAQEGIGSISLLPRRRLRWVRGVTERTDSRTFVIRTYAKLPAALREYTQALHEPEALPQKSVIAQRVIQDLVDISYQEPGRLLGLTSVKVDSDAFFHHSANVAVLSVLMGHRVGLAKAEIGDLGYAALFHDIGKAFTPEAVHALAGADAVAPTTGWMDEDSEASRNHPLRATEHFLGYPCFAESHVRRLLATYHRGIEQNLVAQATAGQVRGRLFGDIIAITDQFDVLTTHRPDRPALMADEALQRMWADRGRRYDTALLKLFILMVGIVPIGMVVELDTAEIGVVIGSHAEGELADRPLVMRVQDAQGHPVTGPVIDLAERHEAGFTRTIVCRRSARELGINVAGVLLA